MEAISSEIVDAFIRIAVAGGIGGLFGGFIGGRGKNLIGSILLGIIGGISASAILRIAGVRAIMNAGEGFGLVYGFVGGFILAFVVGASNR